MGKSLGERRSRLSWLSLQIRRGKRGKLHDRPAETQGESVRRGRVSVSVVHTPSIYSLSLFLKSADMMIITTIPHPACHPRAVAGVEVVVAAILTHPITMATKNTTTTTTVMITMTIVAATMIPTMDTKKCTR